MSGAPDPVVAIAPAGERLDPAVYAEFAELVTRGEPAVLVTVVRTTGSVPRGMGAVMLVRRDGTIGGTVGGGAVERLAIAEARHALADGRARLLHYDCTGAATRNLEMICEGTVDLYVQPAAARSHLVVCGAGHVARALVPLALATGFRATVIDERPGMPVASDFPPGVELLPGDYRRHLAALDLDADATFVVIVTHGHRHDTEVLAACLDRPCRYLGMIGSRSKVRAVFDALGTTEEARRRLERVRAPIGLDLGGRTPSEIALSILAEMTAVKHDRDTIVPLSAQREPARPAARPAAGPSAHHTTEEG
ncbi:MAG: XdhC/CoxI family protein [Candidatus Eiseniibacteriota bacterium]|jgi:xanthine dehydrogenase accessory factor